uniref:MARVEL domain-containing protein n=2 Tax=Entomoneis paludosa TaxID=265537 RepID=A0A7S2Y9D1_9STRA|eukprot:CAMPEP_0172439230 /NCGR_PEP_ID=MMETSP1065-20121228/284_1 /TAXON_ID=265537 /ORGANISM="Amphiprora paludosa, Strain CCMP125" /LENGTH=290 /DNA_ID=CAMNT_0013187881 /DNA_START=113 /DNA_END=985 /DNA_ORIENTATION=-
MTWIATFSCHFFESTQYNTANEQEYSFDVGFWTVENFYWTRSSNNYITGSCVSWWVHASLRSSDVDAALEFGRIITLILSFFSLVAIAGTMFTMCAGIPRNLIQAAAIAFLLFGVFLLLSLTALASDKFCRDAVDCEMRKDAYLAIAGSVLWFVSAAATWFIPDANISHPDPVPVPANKAVVPPAPTNTAIIRTERMEQVTENGDGTRTKLTVVTVVRADGSKDVTETKETTTLPKVKKEVVEKIEEGQDGATVKVTTTTHYEDDGSKSIKVNREAMEAPETDDPPVEMT